MEWEIGNVKINNRIVLAPMSGISNPAFIKVSSEMGVGFAYTELISSEAIIRNNKKTFDMLDGFDSLKIPVAVQLFGNNPKTMAEAAKIVEEKYNFDVIDINMGCPVPKVAIRQKSGSALLKDVDKVYNIVSSVVGSVKCPVTVKIRSGWDEKSINAVLVAKTIEKAGASAICIHGRTRSQGYSGTVDLDIIKSVKDSVSIPVIGNGDIRSVLDAIKMFDYTHVDAIMIGRGILGNPFLTKQILDYLEHGEYKDIPCSYKIDIAIKHLKYFLETNNEKYCVYEFRKIVGWYLKGLPNSINIREKINNTLSSDEVIRILRNYKEELQ